MVVTFHVYLEGHVCSCKLTDILRMNPFMLLISFPTKSFMKHMYSSFAPNLVRGKGEWVEGRKEEGRGEGEEEVVGKEGGGKMEERRRREEFGLDRDAVLNLHFSSALCSCPNE